MSSIEELLQSATTRLLTPDEHQQLAELASAEGPPAVQKALGRLMAGGPTSIMNLRHAAALRAAQATTRPSHEDFRSIKKADRSAMGAGSQMGFKVTFSHHAVERYVERCADSGQVIAIEDAAERLAEEAKHAVQLKAKTFSGEEQWQCPSGAVLIVRRDGGGQPAVCTTVLGQPCGEIDNHRISIEARAKMRARRGR